MFVGHYGVALALKRVEPRLSLGTLFLSVQLVDLLWAAAILLEWERAAVSPGWSAASPLQFIYYPLTHSLLAGVLWAVAAGAVYYSWPTRNTANHARAALVVALAVLSHWPLDWLVHLPDLPLAGDNSPKVGLGLWQSVAATAAAEFLVLGAGAAVYLRGRHQRLRRGPVTALLAVLVLLAFGNIVGPPPAGIETVAVAALVMYSVFPILAWWADRPAERQTASERRPEGEGARHRVRRFRRKA